MRKIELHGVFEVPEDFTGGMVDIGGNFKEAIPLDTLVWYWDRDAMYARLGLYKGVDVMGYLVQLNTADSTVHYEHVKLYKEGDVDIGTEFTECIPLNSIVWYWGRDAKSACLGIYKGVDVRGYLVQLNTADSTVHYEHVKLYKKGEGDVE